MRTTDASPKEISDGVWRVTVPMKPAKWAAWVLRVPDGARKTFELDALGKFVWDACDGRTTVRQIIRRLAKQYSLNEREADVATTAFLNTLARKGLIAVKAPPPRGKS
jgi:hypothetical protein